MSNTSFCNDLYFGFQGSLSFSIPFSKHPPAFSHALQSCYRVTELKDGGVERRCLAQLFHRDSSDAVELPLLLKTRWYSPAMCQGYLNERGMTVASPDSWQEPGRGGRGEWMLRLHQLCLLYVCGKDSITRQCVCLRVSE